MKISDTLKEPLLLGKLMDKQTNKPLDLSSLAEAYDRNVLPTLKARMEAGDNLSAEGDVKFSQLSTEDQIDWVLSVAENLSGELSDEILSDDQRQIATRYDASNAGVTMEMLDEQDRAAESERTAIGRSENAVRDGEGRGAVEQGRAESARPLEGGAVQRDTGDVAQQISDANPITAYIDGQPVVAGNKPIITSRKRPLPKKFSKRAPQTGTPISVEEIQQLAESKYGSYKYNANGAQITNYPGSLC